MPRKPWNADKVLFPELQTGEKQEPPKPMAGTVAPLASSGLVMSPRAELGRPFESPPALRIRLKSLSFEWSIDGGATWREELITFGRQIVCEHIVTFARRDGAVKVLSAEPMASLGPAVFTVYVDGNEFKQSEAEPSR